MIKSQVKKKVRNSIAKMLVILMIFSSVIALSPSGFAEAASAQPSISKTSRNILVGKTYNFNIVNKVKDSTYKWSSSSKSIATVTNKGIVKGIKMGTANITCTVKAPKNTYTLTCKVTIRKPAVGISISNKVLVLNLGQKYNLNRTIIPATSNDITTWTTSDSQIANPDSRGKFTALKEGTVTITGKTLSGKYDEMTIEVVDAEGTVATQVELDKLLGSGAALISIKTDETVNFNIAEGNYSKQELVVDAPKADVVNKGVFKSVTIKQIKPNTWYEQAIGNVINVSAANARIAIDNNASASIQVSGSDTNLAIVNNGTVTGLTVNSNANISIGGTSTQNIPVTANVAGGTLTSSIPLTLTCNERINLVILPGGEATTVTVSSDEFIPVITGNISITVIVGSGETARTISVAPTFSGAVPNNSQPAPTPTPITPTPTPTPVAGGSISGRVTAVSGGSIAVTGGSISVTGGSIAVSGSSIIMNATVRVLKYDGDVSAAIDSILSNPATIISTTNEDGIYVVNDLAVGNYAVVISKEGYRIQVQLASVTAGVTTIVNGSLMETSGDETELINGLVTGSLIDAITGNNIDSNLEFTVQVYNNFNSLADLVLTQAVSGSAFSIELPEGYYTMKIVDNREAVIGVTYATTTCNIVVLGGTTFADQDIILSTLKEAGQATFVLTWGAQPLDLDSHLVGPVENEANYHIYFANLTYPNEVTDPELLHLRLDLDDTSSYGPETTSIYKSVAGGIYVFYVYNFSGNSEGTLVNSNAKVVVTTETGTYTFEVPSGDQERSWVVCTYNSDTGVITPVNQLIDGDYFYSIDLEIEE